MTSPSTRRVAVALGLSLLTIASSRLGSAQGQTGLFDILPLAEGVYAAQPRAGGANAAFVVTGSGVIIVDTHDTPALASVLLEEIRAITDVPVRYVVNTHWHVDHHSGNPAYHGALPSDVAIISQHTTREDIPTLGRDQLSDVMPYLARGLAAAEDKLRSGLNDHGAPLSEAEDRQLRRYIDDQRAYLDRVDDADFQFEALPNLTIERALTLHDADRPVHLLHLGRGHTRGDIVVYLPTERILIAGDLLTQPILWTWSSYPVEYVGTLRALAQLEIDQIVMGHGPVLAGTEYLDLAIEALEAMVAAARSGLEVDQSLDATLDAAAADPSIEGLRRRFVDESQDGMFDTFVTWTVERAFLELRGELE